MLENNLTNYCQWSSPSICYSKICNDGHSKKICYPIPEPKFYSDGGSTHNNAPLLQRRTLELDIKINNFCSIVQSTNKII